MPYLVLSRRGAEQMHVKLCAEAVLIGRGRLCDMQVPDRAVARHQAAVVLDGGQYRLEDRSKKKTLLNGKLVESAWLEDRDYLDLGAYRAHFHDAELADDGPDTSRIQTLVDSRDKPAALPEEMWLTARPLFGGTVVQVALRKQVNIGSDSSNELRLKDDGLVSGKHACVVRMEGRLFLRDAGSTNGTWARGLSIQEMQLPVGERFQVGGFACWVSANPADGEEAAWSFEGLIGRHESMHRLFERILAVALTKASVLIGGETGSGKDLVARAIHRRSERPQGPFIPVNCSTFAPQLLEAPRLKTSERASGAFTTCSGAMYRSVPLRAPTCVSGSPPRMRATPKSVSFTAPPYERRMFAGVTSRWTRLCACPSISSRCA
jgi:pSer/pThr/pTyr-binding forkhead associated (FHA) protein